MSPYPAHSLVPPVSDRLRRRLLACGVVAPIVAFAATFAAMAINPGFDLSRHYLSELGGAEARAAFLFNGGVILAGVLAALAGAGFGLTLRTLTGARVMAVFVALLFALAGYGLIQAGLYPWPDPRHLAINLALGIQLAPPFLALGLRRLPAAARLRRFLLTAFLAMAVLTVLTKHLVAPHLVNDDNVGWWERGYAIVLVGWVGVAAVVLARMAPEKAASSR